MRVARLLRAFCENAADFGSAIQATNLVSPWNLTYVADLIGRRLDELDEASFAVVESATRLHPGRWRFVLRDEVRKAGTGAGLKAAQLLRTDRRSIGCRKAAAILASSTKSPGDGEPRPPARPTIG